MAATLHGFPLHTLTDALIYAQELALDDVLGFVDPFTAVEWRKTLPKEWQRLVENIIVDVYQST